MRVLVAILLLLLLPAPTQAFPVRGATQICQPPSTDGVQYLAPTNCTINAFGHTWSVGGLHNSVGPGYDIKADGTFFTVGDAIGRSGGAFFFRITDGTCGVLWQRYITSGVNTFTAGFGGAELPNFTDTTTSTKYGSWSELLASALANHVLTIQPISPTYGNCWPSSTNAFKSGQTAKLAAAFYQTGGLDIGGNSTNATGVSIIGDSGTPALFNGELRVRDGSTSPLFEYVKVLSLNGAACTGSPGSGILTSNDGTVTLLHVQVSGCGSGGAGQDHNVYISQGAGANDPTGTALITDLISLNVRSGGWSLKMRPAGISTQNHVTQSVIGCTLSGTSCEQNGVIDMPCGGDYNIDFNTLERGPGGDNGYVLRSLEEARNGTTQCPTSYASTNQAIVDHNIIIWDGASPGWAVTNVLCAGTHDGSGNCETGGLPGAGYTYTLTNNVIVGDSAASVMPVAGAGVGSGAGCTLVSGKCTDANNNRWYNNRTTAAANEGWSGNDQFGNPCCAFPWIPVHPLREAP